MHQLDDQKVADKLKQKQADCTHKQQEVIVKRKIHKQFCLFCKKLVYSW